MLDKKQQSRRLHPLGPPQEGLQAGSAHRRHPRGVGRRRRRLHHPRHHPARTGHGRPRLRQHHPGLLHRVAAAGRTSSTPSSATSGCPSSSRTTPSSSGLGRTEPDAGTDSHFLYDEPGKSIQTYAELQGDEYVINGTKHFISSGGAAKLYFLYVRTDKKGPISTSMSVILVPSDAPGFTIGRYHNKFGRRTAAQRRAGVPELPASRPATSSAKRARPGAPRAKAEAARRRTGPRAPAPRRRSACWAPLSTSAPSWPATKRRVNYCRQRIQGGRPVIEQQHVAIDLARMKVQIAAAEALLFKCCWAWESRVRLRSQDGHALQGLRRRDRPEHREQVHQPVRRHGHRRTTTSPSASTSATSTRSCTASPRPKWRCSSARRPRSGTDDRAHAYRAKG